MLCKRRGPTILASTGSFGFNLANTSSAPLRLKDNADLSLPELLMQSQPIAVVVGAAVAAVIRTAGNAVARHSRYFHSRRLMVRARTPKDTSPFTIQELRTRNRRPP